MTPVFGHKWQMVNVYSTLKFIYRFYISRIQIKWKYLLWLGDSKFCLKENLFMIRKWGTIKGKLYVHRQVVHHYSGERVRKLFNDKIVNKKVLIQVIMECSCWIFFVLILMIESDQYFQRKWLLQNSNNNS